VAHRFLIPFLIPLITVCLLAPEAWGQAPPDRQRLILKDGTYQVVLRYEVKNGLVRFRSAERTEEWEELPEGLVDWPATERYNHDHAPGIAPPADSPAAKAAAELDREAASSKALEAARQPVVAPGLRLPDESGVWGYDAFNDKPELVRIRQSDGDLNLDLGHSVKAVPVPQGGARDLIRLQGYRAPVSFHVPRPVFYIALDVKDDVSREDAFVVNTHGAAAPTADKTQKASPDSTYALVRLRVFKDGRYASALQLRALGTGGDIDGSAEIVATERRVLPGGRWMRVTPRSDLNLGQYSLVEILQGETFNADGWDFGVNPLAADNKGAFTPISTDGDEHAP